MGWVVLAVVLMAAAIVAALVVARNRLEDERSARLALDARLTKLTTILFENDRHLHNIAVCHKKHIDELYMVLNLEDDGPYVRYDDSYSEMVQ